MYGLETEVINNIKAVFEEIPNIEKVILYGSRAKGNYKIGSDIDLTLQGYLLSLDTIFELMDKLDNLYLPYKFDLSIYEDIDNSDLLDHIKRVGLVFYQRGKEQIPAC